MNLVKFTPILTKDDQCIISNYRPISALLFFSEVLEHIMYNKLYDCFTVSNVLFNKQFRFRAGHSMKHALLELIDQIYDSFNDKNFFQWIFNDLPKAFDIVDDCILLKKLEYYGIKWRNLSWFQSYLSNRKQKIEYKQDNKHGNTELSNIICGVPQNSFPESLLFIIYVNSSYQTLEFLTLTIFANNTNLFCKSEVIKTLFLKENIELEKIAEWL